MGVRSVSQQNAPLVFSINPRMRFVSHTFIICQASSYSNWRQFVVIVCEGTKVTAKRSECACRLRARLPDPGGQAGGGGPHLVGQPDRHHPQQDLPARGLLPDPPGVPPRALPGRHQGGLSGVRHHQGQHEDDRPIWRVSIWLLLGCRPLLCSLRCSVLLTGRHSPDVRDRRGSLALTWPACCRLWATPLFC